jgi:hypothetical protein
VRMVVTNQRVNHLLGDWEAMARTGVAILRRRAADNPSVSPLPLTGSSRPSERAHERRTGPTAVQSAAAVPVCASLGDRLLVGAVAPIGHHGGVQTPSDRSGRHRALRPASRSP